MLTVLSFGAGQDSTAILYKCIYDPSFKEKYVKGDLVVVMADTGNEHPQTYKHLRHTEALCNRKGIDFTCVTPGMGYHPKGWHSLAQQYEDKSTVGSKAFMKTCTDNLKLKPIYGYLANLISIRYGYHKRGRKAEFYQYSETHGKLRMLIGIAAGEERRMVTDGDKRPLWMQRNIEIVYPLVTESMDRAACQKYILSTGHTVPLPSNCMMCPYMSEQELLWLYHHHIDQFERWEQFENAKLEKYAERGEKNVGVWGKYDKKKNQPVRLIDILVVAENKHGHMTADELNEYKMSHGHCVMSKY